jgi:hypothetical protein
VGRGISKRSNAKRDASGALKPILRDAAAQLEVPAAIIAEVMRKQPLDLVTLVISPSLRW